MNDSNVGQPLYEVETITVYDLDGNKVYMQERVVN